MKYKFRIRQIVRISNGSGSASIGCDGRFANDKLYLAQCEFMYCPLTVGKVGECTEGDRWEGGRWEGGRWEGGRWV